MTEDLCSNPFHVTKYPTLKIVRYGMVSNVGGIIGDRLSEASPPLGCSARVQRSEDNRGLGGVC